MSAGQTTKKNQISNSKSFIVPQSTQTPTQRNALQKVTERSLSHGHINKNPTSFTSDEIVFLRTCTGLKRQKPNKKDNRLNPKKKQSSNRNTMIFL